MKKEVSYITRHSVRGILVFCIWLYVLLSGVRAYASDTADSVYFHIRIDTLREIRAGQIVELTYALVNSQFDSVAPPVFGDNIEIVGGPEPHECSSYAIVNGVESKSRESGFRYHVRFRQDGEVEIPAASVIAGNRTYTAPGCRVSVQPDGVDADRLKCSLTVNQLTGGYAKYRAILTCNACPDQNPPLLSINGKTTRPTSNSYSRSDGREEYVYCYYFSGDGYEVSCEDLTFGGVPYHVSPRKSKIDEADFPVASLIAGALFELAWWLAYRRRYRLEKDAAFADFVLEHKRVPLTINWAYTHYGASHILSLMSALFLFMTGMTLYSAGRFDGFFLSVAIVPVPVAYVLYRVQRRRLEFQCIPTTLDRQEIYGRIYGLSVTYDWDVDHYGEDCIVAHTNPSLWSMTWGEIIFIVFDRGQVWVNSVNDLNKRTSLCSFGHNERNIRRIREVLEQGAPIRDQETHLPGVVYRNIQHPTV